MPVSVLASSAIYTPSSRSTKDKAYRASSAQLSNVRYVQPLVRQWTLLDEAVFVNAAGVQDHRANIFALRNLSGSAE